MAAQGLYIQLSSAARRGCCHGLHLTCIHFGCIFGAGESSMPICSSKMALPKNKELFSQCPKKTFFWGRWLSSFASRHFSNSHCSALSLPGMLVGWENMRLEKWRKRQFEWIQIFSEDLGEEGVRCMWKEEMRGRRVRTPLGWERVLGEEMCF